MLYVNPRITRIVLAPDKDCWIASVGEGEDRVTGRGWNPADALAEMMQYEVARHPVISLDRPKRSKSKRQQMKTAEREMKLDELRRAYASVDKLSGELGLITRGPFDSVQGIAFIPKCGLSGRARMLMMIPDGFGKWVFTELEQVDDGTFQFSQCSGDYESIDSVRQDLAEWYGV